jgi:ankyrin repeat protein
MVASRLVATVSPVLDALYHGQTAEAERLAAELGAEHLSVHEAAALGSLDRLRRLLSTDPGVAYEWSADGFQPLGLACFFGRRAAVELLLTNAAELNTPARNAFQVTALHAALAGPDPGIAATLIAAGADVNAAQQGGVTPLQEAAHIGDANLVRLLLDHGANVSGADDRGRTAADYARERGHTAVLELLDAPR